MAEADSDRRFSPVLAVVHFQHLPGEVADRDSFEAEKGSKKMQEFQNHILLYAAIAVLIVAIVAVLLGIRRYLLAARRFARRYPGVNPAHPEGCLEVYRGHRARYLTDIEAKRVAEEDARAAYLAAKNSREDAEDAISRDDRFAGRHGLLVS